MMAAAKRTLAALRLELRELDLAGPRAAHCGRVALAVALAVVAALVLRVDAPWWAAISAFVSTQVTAPASLRRGALRIVGTAIGAAAGLLLSPWLIEDRVAVCLALFLASSFGVLGFQVSRHGYAWLLGAATTDMVLLAALADPRSALSVAGNRTAEVIIGTLCAILVAHLLSPRAERAQAASQAPGWSDLLGARWAATQHALRAGLGVMLVPLAWDWLQLPGFSQAAITVAAVMAVPALSEDESGHREAIGARGIHRILGCLIGGLAGLAVLAVSFEDFLPWLIALTIGVWVAAHVQGSTRAIGYVGTQGAVVFIMTMVQGSGPPSSIIPGFERLAGITGGLFIVMTVALLLAPSSPSSFETRAEARSSG
jgi:uncharacterized membrane protein YccC